jgi:sterol desaturase/sphingolipid hydroxylase (fatty acid hydroxylase superfamily)
MMLSSKRFLVQMAILLLSMGLISLIEKFSPLRPRDSATGRARVNLALTVLVLALNWLLSMGATAMGLGAAPHGFVERFSASWPARVLISIAILDLSTFAAHVAMHKVPLLWRVHRVHHSDPFVDVTTTLRFHPIEPLWRFSWTLAPALLFGLTAQGVVAYQVLSALNALFEHANLSIDSRLDSVLSWLWVTPSMHKVHHSADHAETDSNYGNIFAFYDRVFRTFTPTDRAVGVKYGLRTIDRSRATSLAGVLALPFEASGPAGVRARRESRL